MLVCYCLYVLFLCFVSFGDIVCFLVVVCFGISFWFCWFWLFGFGGFVIICFRYCDLLVLLFIGLFLLGLVCFEWLFVFVVLLLVRLDAGLRCVFCGLFYCYRGLCCLIAWRVFLVCLLLFVLLVVI